MKLQTEWGKKKEELQTKKQKDAYQKMTQEQRLLEDFKKQCEDNMEAGTATKIEGKLIAGKELSPEDRILQIKARLLKELEVNVGLKVEDTATTDTFKVSGRGELHLSILLENMRREGYELCVSKPEVLYKEIDGKKSF